MIPTHVYVIGDGSSGPVKIGISRAPHARSEQLQQDKGLALSVRASIKIEDRIHARRVERMAHSLLTHARAEGEWFNVTEDQAIEAIREAISLVEQGLEPPSAIGVPVFIRLSPDLLARLDKSRGGLTRPQEIRRLLDAILETE